MKVMVRSTDCTRSIVPFLGRRLERSALGHTGEHAEIRDRRGEAGSHAGSGEQEGRATRQDRAPRPERQDLSAKTERQDLSAKTGLLSWRRWFPAARLRSTIACVHFKPLAPWRPPSACPNVRA